MKKYTFCWCFQKIESTMNEIYSKYYQMEGENDASAIIVSF